MYHLAPTPDWFEVSRNYHSTLIQTAYCAESITQLCPPRAEQLIGNGQNNTLPRSVGNFRHNCDIYSIGITFPSVSGHLNSKATAKMKKLKLV
jgi:hypothetical protein